MSKHGAPDWSVYRVDSLSYTVMDLAEQAARLGSINIFDRRGDTLFMEDFEHGLNKWWFSLISVGSAAALDPTHARSKGYSLKLTSGTSYDYVQYASHDEPYSYLSTFGFEISATNNDNLSEFGIWLYIYTGTVRLASALIYFPTTTTLAYLDDEGDRITLDTVNLPSTNRLFNTFKLVIDAVNRTYKHTILNASEYAMPDIPLLVQTDTVTDPSMRIRIITVGDSDDNHSIYVDDAIITRDEP